MPYKQEQLEAVHVDRLERVSGGWGDPAKCFEERMNNWNHPHIAPGNTFASLALRAQQISSMCIGEARVSV